MVKKLKQLNKWYDITTTTKLDNEHEKQLTKKVIYRFLKFQKIFDKYSTEVLQKSDKINFIFFTQQ